MNNTRTVKTMGSNGLESFTTVVLDSIHYESHLMCTNCGPMGLKADTEPNGNRAALTDRPSRTSSRRPTTRTRGPRSSSTRTSSRTT